MEGPKRRLVWRSPYAVILSPHFGRRTSAVRGVGDSALGVRSPFIVILSAAKDLGSLLGLVRRLNYGGSSPKKRAQNDNVISPRAEKDSMSVVWAHNDSVSAARAQIDRLKGRALSG